MTLGKASLKTTVSLSGAVAPMTEPFGLTEFTRSERSELFSAHLFQLNTTSLASRLRPLSGGRGSEPRFLRILKVSVRRSGENSHDSAASPLTSPLDGALTPGCTRNRRL